MERPQRWRRSPIWPLSPSPSAPLVLRLDITLADLSLTLNVFLRQENPLLKPLTNHLIRGPVTDHSPGKKGGERHLPWTCPTSVSHYDHRGGDRGWRGKMLTCTSDPFKIKGKPSLDRFYHLTTTLNLLFPHELKIRI